MGKQYKANDHKIVLVLAILAGILIARCFFSFCQSDESFYAALINRFWSGEKPIQDEWHRAQLYTPLLLPYYWVFHLLNRSTEGVILYFRLIYVFFAIITAVKLYQLVFKKTTDSSFAAILAAVILLYSRANISGASYYNLCMLCSVSGICSIAEAVHKEQKKKYLSMIWAGILIACAVLCNPFLAPVIISVVLISLVMKKRNRETLALSAGILGMAAIYCFFLLHTTGFRGIIDYFPYILRNSEQNSVIANLLLFARRAIRLSKFTVIPAVLMTVVLILERNRNTINKLCLPIYMAVQTAALSVTAILSLSQINDIILLPLSVAAFPCWIISLERKQSVPARHFYLFGLLNAVAFSAASNTGVDAGTVGFCISGIGGLWIIRDVLLTINTEDDSNKENIRGASKQCKSGQIVVVLLAIVLLVPMFCQRVVGVYRDAPLWKLDTRLVQGPGKGLFTTKNHAAQYESICDSLKELSELYPEGRILYCKNLPWAYLVTNYGYGTSSPWRTYTEDLENYYTVRPDNRADYLCVLNETVGCWEKSPFNNNPEAGTPNAFNYEGEFWERVKQNPIITETELLQVYDVREMMHDPSFEQLIQENN